MEATSNSRPTVRLRDLVLYFLRLGAFGFGGPVALCGQMERELVQERKWLSRDEMRDGIAVCQSLPGPLAIQVGIFVSYVRGGFWGAWAGGWRSSCQILLSCPRLVRFTSTSADCQS
jgi:chromate transporter